MAEASVHEPMDVDVDDDVQITGELAADSDSSGLDEGSGDDYIEEGVEQDVSTRDGDDAVFNRIAAQVSGGAAGAGPQDFSQEFTALDEDDIEQPAGRKQSKRRIGGYRGHRPLYEVQQLLGRANMAYISQNHTEAVNLFLEVIRHDNMVQAAWTTLASVYEEMGDFVMARQMKFCAAHIEEDAGTWAELAIQLREENNLPQALYCYRKLLRLDSSRTDVLWQMITIYSETGQTNKAVSALRKLHKADATFLRDFNMLMAVHPILADTRQWVLGATVFGDAFVYHYATFDSPEDPNNTMRIEHVVEYVNYLLKSGEAETAIDVIHRGQRWLQGRKHEKAWDTVEDDSEYATKGADDDADDDADDTAVSGGNDLDVQLRHSLAVARLRLDQQELAMGHVNYILQLDAKVHGAIFKELGDALMKRQMWDLALECWAALHERIDADDQMDDDPDVIFKLGVCQHQLKRLPEALESLNWVVEMQPSNTEARLELASVYEDMGKKTEALEIVSEVIRRGELVSSTRDAAPKPKAERAAGQRLNKRVLEAQATFTMQALWEDVQRAEDGINSGDPWALDKFIHAAGTMIETFRLAKSNFTKNRGITRIPKRRKYGYKNDITSQAQAMQDRLERTIGMDDDNENTKQVDYEIRRQTDFYGVSNEDWLALTIKYCCVLMVKNEEDVAMDILEHMVWSGLFNSRRCEIALRLTMIACAMRMRSFERITDNCKRLAQIHQFRTEPLLLMLAALGGGQRAQLAWHNVALQKFLHREMRIFDEAVYGVKLRYNPRHHRWAQVLESGRSRRFGDFAGANEADEPDSNQRQSKKRDEDDEEDLEDDEDEPEDGESVAPSGTVDEHECPKPTKYSPVFNTLYGQNMLTTKSYQSALFYFMRAYELNPHDPFLCLLIAQAFFGRALNRQSDNRNFQITQGMMFLTKYRKLSPQDREAQEEVEYNYGRAFHGLGVTHLAVTHYERVLDSVRFRMEAAESAEESERVRQQSLAWEAAHNVVLIYTTSGSLGLVRARSDEWLALTD